MRHISIDNRGSGENTDRDSGKAGSIIVVCVRCFGERCLSQKALGRGNKGAS